MGLYSVIIYFSYYILNLLLQTRQKAGVFGNFLSSRSGNKQVYMDMSRSLRYSLCGIWISHVHSPLPKCFRWNLDFEFHMHIHLYRNVSVGIWTLNFTCTFTFTEMFQVEFEFTCTFTSLRPQASVTQAICRLTLNVYSLSYLLISNNGVFQNGVWKMSLSLDNTTLLVLHYSGKLTLWELPSLRLKQSWRRDEQVGDACT